MCILGESPVEDEEELLLLDEDEDERDEELHVYELCT
jgi:hypothetical protein